MTVALKDRLANLEAGDQRLLLALAGTALAALLVGTAGGVLTALVRSGLIEVPADSGYRVLTVHGTSVFFYWLYLAQGAILMTLAGAERGKRLVGAGIGWMGLLLMLAGFALTMGAAAEGTPFLYDGNPSLAADEPRRLAAFSGGYVLLGLGLLALPLCAIRTLLAGVRATGSLSAMGFALFAWGGFLMVSGFAALYAFGPGLAWGLGWGAFPQDHSTNWHILFHNMHYLPLMATVIVWYALMQELTGVKSIFGETFSKVVFTLYLVFVPPTSLYHMFLEPDLPGVVRVTGSLLSLFVSVPSLTAFLIIVASLEVHARAMGGRGLFGWIRLLPWREPALMAVGVAVLNMVFGLVFAFVLIQAELAPLLSDTFFVPGYFHFFTVGTVSFSLLAALAVILPALTERRLALGAVARWMPPLASLGLLAFGGAGVAAGYLGLPRRVMDATYGGEAPAIWGTLMALVASGGVVMAVALAVFALAVGACLLPRRAGLPERLVWLVPGTSPRPGVAAVAGPVSVLAIVLAMYGFTAIGFEMMQALPLDERGGGHGH